MVFLRSAQTGFEQCFGVQETVLLVNHAFARGTPTIFVIFVVSRGLSSKAFVLLVRMQIRHFRRFRQKPLVLAGQKHGLPKAPLRLGDGTVFRVAPVQFGSVTV